ncbi:transglutaminase family protein [Roseibium aggregatum]|uniref:Transglutaminase family protein n=1 Tax=Roseibium aggregatum TaxID=187304 RepID=A0A939J1Q9_9HYPH|nr:transglutaminase family protein [Roseibium aggregatum]MBN9670618.1 transglutaminase family protein [Roseibium aggregatum]
MRFSVQHETCYQYSVPVSLGDHLLRLTPRPDSFRVLQQNFEIDPEPVWRRDELDRYGTPVTRFGFSGETQVLRIVSKFEGETVSYAEPLPGLQPLPWSQGSMVEYLGAGENAPTHRFAGDLAAECGGQAETFLNLLTRVLFERFDRHIRMDGNAQSAAETLALGRGACRDLAVLFMAACRSQGIPARFVSGYQAFSETADGGRHLHAWPEVWFPGAGWRGYDPTHGIAVRDGHVALAAAPDQEATMPVEGGFWGNGVTSTLDYRVRIEAG